MSKTLHKRASHNVEITPLTSSDSLMVQWNGFRNRHDYIFAKNLDDLDFLVTELSQAVYNYKRKTVIYRKP